MYYCFNCPEETFTSRTAYVLHISKCGNRNINSERNHRLHEDDPSPEMLTVSLLIN